MKTDSETALIRGDLREDQSAIHSIQAYYNQYFKLLLRPSPEQLQDFKGFLDVVLETVIGGAAPRS